MASFLATMNVSLFVTGSNSTLLSRELATLLTGRTVEFEVLPFTFSEMEEYYKLNNRDFSDDLFFEYLKWGGFPLQFDFPDEESIKRYISNLYDSILNRDIINRKTRMDKKAFRDISLYILANAGKEFSTENIVKSYQDKSGKAVSVNTIYTYLEKMKKAYLIHGVNRYNLSGKASLGNRE